MPSRRAFVVLTAVLAALLAAFAMRPPVAGALPRDTIMKTSVLALQGAIERSGAARTYVFPAAGVVTPRGGLRIAFWPRDPWTGRRLTPGRTRGHYAYTPGSDRRSYRLVGYLSGGRTFVVRGRMAHLPMLAYDHRGWEGLNLIYEYVREWSLAHDGDLPEAAQVTRDGAVGSVRSDRIWPSNPWDHRAMAQRDDRGSFAYVRSADGRSFTLVLHEALKGDYVLHGKAVTARAADRP
jgi:hypothetical protein